MTGVAGQSLSSGTWSETEPETSAAGKEKKRFLLKEVVSKISCSAALFAMMDMYTPLSHYY